MENLVELIIQGTGMDLWDFVLLCGVSFVGSFITAGLGIGGGLLVLASMAQILAPTTLIPIHAVVQLGSNTGRVILFFRNILLTIIPAFLVGTIIGAAVGAHVVVALPKPVLQTILALFVLYATWAPKIQAKSPGKKTFFSVGLFGSFTTMFIGATGSLVAPFVSAACKERNQFVATHAALMTIQHTLKILAFGILGFAYGPFIPLLVGLIGFGFAGTFCGKLVLNRLPEHIFRKGLKIILTLLAFRLIFAAITSYMG